MVDAILSYHVNGATCGVAKFNQQLADRLGVPCLPFDQAAHSKYPLYSIKLAEIPDAGPWRPEPPFQLFLHDWRETDRFVSWLYSADRIFVANLAIGRQLDKYIADWDEAFCPSTIQGNPHRAALNVLVFGMAHKINLSHFVRLKVLLDNTREDYTVSVSTAVHEGSPWSEASEAGDRLRAIFGDCTRVLGYLADDALARELQECSAVAMFFDPALRANNTSFHGAYDAHCRIITNLDADSPRFKRMPFDIATLTEWPWEWSYASVQRDAPDYTWDRLLEIVQR
jgi:hypothetical protein